MIKLASWNVNSLNVRLQQILDWLETSQTDILALQETKVVDTLFPAQAFIDRGYHLHYSGQKTYNGVAVISRFPLSEVVTDIPDLDDPQRRILAVNVANIRLVNLYVPNGSEVGSEKYAYKLAWLEKIHAYLADQMQQHERMAVVGDFNIAPEDRDVHSPAEWQGSVLVSEKERDAFLRIAQLGFKDSFRLFEQQEGSYSWWDYRAAGFRRNRGLRIDHILLSPRLAQCCTQSMIDIEPRKNERPSDHAPVWVNLDLER